MTDSADDPLAFTPVPSASRRRDGWTEARQREFIAALSRCGSATAAARQVGKSVRGAYALRERAGAESFAAAWHMAVAIGIDATRDCVIDRAMHGGWVPVVRRGRIVRMEFRQFDRMAIAILSGRGKDIEEQRAEAARVRAYRKSLREEDLRRAAVRKAAAEAEARAAEERKKPRVREFRITTF